MAESGGISVVMVTPSYAPELTGVGRCAGELASGLAARSQRVEVISTPPHYPGWHVRPPYRAWRYTRERRDGVTVWRCPVFVRRGARGVVRLAISLSFAVTSLPIIFWRIMRTRPDVVLCVEPTLAAAPAALLAARIVGAKTLLHVHDLELDAALAVGHIRLRGRILAVARVIERFLLRRFDRVVTISTAMTAAIERKGVAAARLSVQRNWVDVSRIRPLDSVSAYRAELGIPADACVCLYAGQIGRKQALHLVLEAAARMTAEHRFQFVIAGDGPELAPLRARYGVLPNVRFLPLQPEERLCELLGLADVHVLPQGRDVCDMVLPSKLGGMLASGRRILVTAEAGSELVHFLDGSATIVAPGSVDAIVSGLHTIADSEDETRAKRLALARSLSAASSLDAFDRLILELANGGPSPARPISTEPLAQL